jgi:hypothetical protein
LIKNISTNMKAHLFHLLFEACSKGKWAPPSEISTNRS